MNATSLLAQEIAAELIRQGVGQAPAPVSNRRVLQIDQAAEYLGCSPNKLRDLEAAGRIRRVEIDSRLRFDIRDLDKFIEGAKL
jgi:excisionase family DNA binding protein